MASSTNPRRPSRLRTGFYVWFRKNHNEIQRLVTVEKYSQRALLEELKWTSFVDAKLAIELLNKFEKQIAEGDWKGVELELFGSRSWYEKLPSVQRAFYELRDHRATGQHVPVAKKKRAPGRLKTSQPKAGRVGVETPSTAAPVAPIVAVPTPVSAQPTPAIPAPVAPIPKAPEPVSAAPAPTVSSPSAPPIAASVGTKTPFSTGPKIVPKSVQLRQVESQNPTTRSHF